MRATATLLLLGIDAVIPFALLTARPHTPTARCHVRCAAGDDWEKDFMDELRARMSQPGSTRMGPPHEVLRDRNAVWVLLFNRGQPDEGVYTLQSAEARAGGAASFVLGFEEDHEARRFAQLLKAEGFDMAEPTRWPAAVVSDYCHMARFQLGIVPTGSLLNPPSSNEYDHSAFERLKKESAAMEESNPELDAMRQKLERIFRDDFFGM